MKAQTLLLLTLLASALAAPTTFADDARIERAVTAVIEAQQQAWNAGDIAGYMAHYWKSEQLTFSSEGKTTRGWKQTKARYDKRYATRDLMGRLTFDELEVYPLGADAAFVLGRWRLHREADSPGGNFSLVFRRLDGRWVIVHDHTSSDPKE
jgi:beta-aspartyl-peptidase (threonine type)